MDRSAERQQVCVVCHHHDGVQCFGSKASFNYKIFYVSCVKSLTVGLSIRKQVSRKHEDYEASLHYSYDGDSFKQILSGPNKGYYDY